MLPSRTGIKLKLYQNDGVQLLINNAYGCLSHNLIMIFCLLGINKGIIKDKYLIFETWGLKVQYFIRHVMHQCRSIVLFHVKELKFLLNYK